MLRTFLLTSTAIIFACFSGAAAQVAEKSEAIKNLEVLGFDEKSFVDGNLYFIAYHELAHAFVSEFDIPVVGREEDAADRMAIWFMTPADEKDEPEYLLGAIEGWFATANEKSLNDIEWWDEHGTDQQRGYQIGCLLYGADASRYEKIAKELALPEERRESCVFESDQNQRAWNGLLEPHTLGEKGTPTAGKISVKYRPTGTYGDDLAYLKELGLLEDIAKTMEDNYKFEPGIQIVAEECNEPNAFWNSGDRKMTICYELVRDFRRLTTK